MSTPEKKSSPRHSAKATTSPADLRRGLSLVRARPAVDAQRPVALADRVAASTGFTSTLAHFGRPAHATAYKVDQHGLFLSGRDGG